MIKKVTARVARKESRNAIIFRVLVTVFEALAAVLIAISPELGTPEKVTLAVTVAGAISAVINVLKESGLFGGVENGD